MDEYYVLPVFETVQTAWRKVKGTKATIWALLGSLFVIEFIFGLITNPKQPIFPIPMSIALIFQVISMVIQFIFTWALVYVGIQRALDNPVTFRDSLKYVNRVGLFFRMIVLYILEVIVILVPVIVLALIPMLIKKFYNLGMFGDFVVAFFYIGAAFASIYIILGLYLASGLVIKQNMVAIDAIKESFAVIQNNRFRLIGLTIINMFILMIAMIPLGLGLIWVFPYLFICYGVVYEKLVNDRSNI
jgi:hypothetical protein